MWNKCGMWNDLQQPIDHLLSYLIQHNCDEWNFLAILFGTACHSAFFQPQHISSQFFHFCYIISTDLSTKIHGLKLHITFSWKSWALQWDICSGFILLLLKLRRPLYFPHHPSQFERQAGRDYSHCDATNIAFPDVFPPSLPKLWDELKYLPTSHEMRLRLERRSRKEGVLSPTTHKECQVIALSYSKYSNSQLSQ